jgi:hypothetical protein
VLVSMYFLYSLYGYRGFQLGSIEVSLAMIAANNHYAGFGPRTANLFRKMVGLSNYPGKFNYDGNNKRRKREDQHVSDSE